MTFGADRKPEGEKGLSTGIEREQSSQGKALSGDVADQQDSTGTRTERLLRITAVIAHAVTREEVVEAVVDRVAMSLGASSAALWLLDPPGGGLTLVRSLGSLETAKQSISSLSLDSAVQLPMLEAVRSSTPVWLNSRAESPLKYSDLAALLTPGRSYRVCYLPLVVQDGALGALAFTFDGVQPFEACERDLLILVARYAGQAIEKLRLSNLERQAREEAEASAARLRLLSRTSRELSKAERSLPLLLQTFVEQVTQEYADIASLFLLGNANAPLELAAVHHRVPETARLIRSVLEARPVTMGEGFSGQVAASGVPIRLTDVDPELLLQHAPAELRESLAEFVPHSVLLVPLKARGQVIGTLGVARHAPAPAFSSSDRCFLEELAERAANAIETRRLNEENAHGRLRAELLYDMADAVIRADGLEDVFEAALDALQSALGTARSAILAFDADGVMRFRASRGISEGYRRAVEGHSPWQREERYPDPLLVPDVLRDPEFLAYQSVFELENIRALAFIPLSTGGRLLGKFMVYYERPRELSRSELDMAVACGNHVAAAMARYSALTELEETVRLNEIFTGILGHDLRNPLGAILTAAEVALKRAEGEKVTKPLSRIISSGTRMSRMIDQLLDFTRVRVGSGIPVVPERVDLLDLLQHVIDELEGTFPGRLSSPEVLGHDVHGRWDADRLSQVFSNLIANALRHGRDETAVAVRIDARDASTVRIDVHNLGVVPPALFPSLFEPMAGGKGQVSGAQGLGLGLYISREIVRAHGGQILVSSSEPEGTTFSVLLPRMAVVPVSLERHV